MAIDTKRRQAVMGRSRKLGHCVCNPRQPCPCETLVNHNICPCAGEKMPKKEGTVPLTRHVRKAGCASKIGQADLLRVLGKLPVVEDPKVLLGAAAGDDAGVYDISESQALIQTVDVFTPNVDDPYLFGQIAAANSVSDVYAMGGTPLSALSVIGFPIDDLDDSVMEEILRGGIDKMAEASCPVIGGHSLNDEEVKCGFAVTGIIDKDKLVERDKAKPGDALVLTKPLGMGMISFAAQMGRVREEALREMGEVMATLNRDAAECMVEYGANGATDVTGYGLAGHLVAMVRGSGVTAEIDMSKVPVISAAKACLEQEILSGAVERNQSFALAWIRLADPAAERTIPLFYDPQTSGGMLISLPAERAEALVAEMHRRGHTATAIIGRVVANAPDVDGGRVVITQGELANFHGLEDAILPPDPSKQPAPVGKKAATTAAAEDEFECCPGGPPVFDDEDEGAEPAIAPSGSAPVAPAPDGPAALPTGGLEPQSVEARFMTFMKAASQAGRIDERHKKLMAVALSISHHCEPCLRSHLKSAVAMGITKVELDEVANLATSFGGCSSLMFYKELCLKLEI